MNIIICISIKLNILLFTYLVFSFCTSSFNKSTVPFLFLYFLFDKCVNFI
ncbi:uncharacterized protein DS421_19g663870 [Arachis hypogaea]|uniref:Uncharacterized protein n=1 Tax=Arachis hypogaea TaxID=3818 RepID=A0A6B9VF08_ARAHY|nr:uncharacterized protein DS421_19g663870 [Arachis hypogaea]